MKRFGIDDNETLLDAFHANDDRIIGQYYAALKPEFQKNIAFKFSYLPTDYLDDVYQDSFIELGEQMSSGELNSDTLTVPVGAYLYGIGKKIALEYINKYGFASATSLDGDDSDVEIANPKEESTLTKEDCALIHEYVEKMGEPCASVLKKFYFEEFTMFGIAWLMKYKSEDVAKTRKNKCMDKLIDAVNKGLYGKFDIDTKH